MNDYTITDARYAKRMKAVHAPGDGSGWMTRTQRLANHLASRYSGREKAYIMSAHRAEKFIALHASGADASPITGELRT